MSSNNGPDPAPNAGRAAGWWARHGLDLALLRMFVEFHALPEQGPADPHIAS